MLVLLQCIQIPLYWDIIKFAAIKANLVESSNIGNYSINLLAKLLSGKSQCLLSIRSGRITKVTIIEIFYDEILDSNFMTIDSIYGFSKQSLEVWKKESEQLYAYAKDRKCKSVKATTNNPLVIDLANKHGMIEESRNYIIKLG